MARLFGRKCVISVEGHDVANLDVTFDIKRTLGFGAGTAKVEIFNLKEDSRRFLSKLSRANLVINAGYASEMSQLFSGDLRTPVITRKGADIVTALEGSDCSWIYGGDRAKVSLPPGATGSDAASQLVANAGVFIGKLTGQIQEKLSGLKFPTGYAFDGNAGRELQKLAASVGFELSVQDGQFQAVEIGKTFAAKAQVLSPATGLIETPTPQRSNTPNVRLWNCKALIRPGLLPARAVRVESSAVTGDFRIREVSFIGSTFGPDWNAVMVLEDMRFALPGV